MQSVRSVVPSTLCIAVTRSAACSGAASVSGRASAAYAARDRTFFSLSIQTNSTDSAAVCAANETLTLIERLCVLPFARQSLDRSVEIVRVWFRFALGVL